MSQILTTNNDLIRYIAIFISVLGLCFSRYYIPKTIKIINKNTMPYHLEWLAQSLICFLIINLYNIIFITKIVDLRPEYIKVLHWSVYISLLYFNLFTTKFITKKCEFVTRIYTLVTQLVFGMVAVYAIMEIFMSRMGPMYVPQNENAYTFIYNFRPIMFFMHFILSVVYCIYTCVKQKYKKSVIFIKISVLFVTASFLLSYFISSLFPIFFIIYEIFTFICMQLTRRNVLTEGGRFLND